MVSNPKHVLTIGSLCVILFAGVCLSQGQGKGQGKGQGNGEGTASSDTPNAGKGQRRKIGGSAGQKRASNVDVFVNDDINESPKVRLFLEYTRSI